MKTRSTITPTSVALLVTTAVLLGGCQTALAPWGAVRPAAESSSTARTRGDATPVAWDRIDATALREPVLVTADDPVAVPFLGRTVWLDAQTTALFGTSPDTLYVACLAGRVGDATQDTTDGQATTDVGVQAQAGRLLLWTPASPTPRSHAFDASHLRESMTLTDAPDADAALAALQRRQHRRVWWGNLQGTGVNAVASTPAEQNAQRAAYLQNADVVDLRFNPADPDTLAQRVAGAFVAALRDGDGDRVARLMSPRLGVETATPHDTSRATVAHALAARNWDALTQPTPAGDTPLSFHVAADDADYRLDLAPGDGLYYVIAIRRQPATATITQGASR